MDQIAGNHKRYKTKVKIVSTIIAISGNGMKIGMQCYTL